MGVAESEFDWREEVMQDRVSYTEVGRLGNYAGLSMSSCVRERERGAFLRNKPPTDLNLAH